MKKCMKIVVVALLIISCKTKATAQNEVGGKPTPAYEQQKENLEKGIYFRATGNEPKWSLKISETAIEFTSLKPGFESFKTAHVEPVRAMDANVKMYRLTTESGKMSVQIMQQKCVNTMSGEKFPYSVKIEISKNNGSTTFSGCGNYVTDYRLHDIWVLEKLNTQTVNPSDFMKELPRLELNSSTNKFAGFAGCNRMNGTLYFERGLLRFSKVITTRMACPGNNKEADFLKALQSTTTYKVENGKLILSNPSGEKLVFKKVD